MTIQSAWLVRVLAGSRRWHHCTECGSRMFVKGSSGLCPICFTRRHRVREEVDRIIDSQLPAIES